jgi:hypothetical protein
VSDKTAPGSESLVDGFAKNPRYCWYGILISSAMIFGLAISFYMGWFDTDPTTNPIKAAALLFVAIFGAALAIFGLYCSSPARRST